MSASDGSTKETDSETERQRRIRETGGLYTDNRGGGEETDGRGYQGLIKRKACYFNI